MTTTETPRARFERIKSEVMLLTPKQQLTIIQLLGANKGEVKEVDLSSHTARIVGVISQVLEEQTGGKPPPYSILIKRMGPTIVRATAALDGFLMTAAPGLRETEREAVYLYLVRLVCKLMRRDKGIPLTVTTMVQQLEQVALYVDRAFPGYIKAGLFSEVLKGLSISSR